MIKKILSLITLLTHSIFIASLCHAEITKNNLSIQIQRLDHNKVERLDYFSHRIEAGNYIRDKNTKNKFGNIETQWRFQLRGIPTDLNISIKNGKIFFGTNENNFSGHIWTLTPARNIKDVTALTYPTEKPVFYPIYYSMYTALYHKDKETTFFAVTNDYTKDEPHLYFFNENFTKGGVDVFKPFIDFQKTLFYTRLGPPAYGGYNADSSIFSAVQYSIHNNSRFLWLRTIDISETGHSNFVVNGTSGDIDYFFKIPASSKDIFYSINLNPFNIAAVDGYKIATSFYLPIQNMLNCNEHSLMGLFGGYENLSFQYKMKWHDCSPQFFSSPIIHPESGMSYVGGSQSIVKAVKIDGTTYFNRLLGGDLSQTQPTIGPDDRIYFPSTNGYIYVLKPDGRTDKELHFSEGSTIHGFEKKVVIGPNGYVYATTADGYLVVFNPNAKAGYELVAAYDCDAKTSPAVSQDGTIYVGSADGYLYSLTLQF